MVTTLANKVETNWASGIFCHVMESRRKGILWRTYGNMVTKILGILASTLERKNPLETLQGYGDIHWGRIGCLSIDEVVVQKPPKVREVRQNQ